MSLLRTQIVILSFLSLVTLVVNFTQAVADSAKPKTKIPSAFQALSLTKQMLAREKSATLMVKLPPGEVTGNNDPNMGPSSTDTYTDFPFGQVELIAEDCQYPSDLLIFASGLEITMKSVLHYKNNVTIAIRDTRFDQVSGSNTTYDPLTHHRATLLGSLNTTLPTKNDKKHIDEYKAISDCFFKQHPDAKPWEQQLHDFRFYRFSVQDWIHYIGGFGDNHYIGWIPKMVQQDEDILKQGEKQLQWINQWSAAPNNGLCWNPQWGQECWALALETQKVQCCPQDDDNDFNACCITEAGQMYPPGSHKSGLKDKKNGDISNSDSSNSDSSNSDSNTAQRYNEIQI